MGRRRDRSYKYSVRACLELKPVKRTLGKHLYLGAARKQGPRPGSRFEDLVDNMHFLRIDQQ